jgi:hypothetical protein
MTARVLEASTFQTNEPAAFGVEDTASPAAGRTAELSPLAAPVQKRFALERDRLMVVNPDSLRFGTDRHHQAIAGPTRNSTDG